MQGGTAAIEKRREHIYMQMFTEGSMENNKMNWHSEQFHAKKSKIYL